MGAPASQQSWCCADNQATRMPRNHKWTHISYVVLVHQAFNAVVILKDMHVPCVKGEGHEYGVVHHAVHSAHSTTAHC